MSILVIVEHNNEDVNAATLNTIAAAQQIGGNIDLLVAGHDCEKAAKAAANIAGITKVLSADSAEYAHNLAENLAPLIKELSAQYSHILAPATTFGKNIMPRAAALCDIPQISDIIDVIDADTFKRPIYAGNAIATVKSADKLKIITVRSTAFEAVSAAGGNAAVEAVSGTGDSGLSSYVKSELSSSERPELTSAGIVISGGRGMKRLLISWVLRLVHHVRQWMQALCPMITRLARLARLLPLIYMWQLAYLGPSSIWLA